jgi:5'-3' exoribonuclease 1
MDAHFGKNVADREKDSIQYEPSWKLAKKLKVSSLSLSRLTSKLIVLWGKRKVNIGLQLKFDSRGHKVLGYSQKTEKGWEFSSCAISIIIEYQVNEILIVVKISVCTKLFGCDFKCRLHELQRFVP